MFFLGFTKLAWVEAFADLYLIGKIIFLPLFIAFSIIMLPLVIFEMIVIDVWIVLWCLLSKNIDFMDFIDATIGM